MNGQKGSPAWSFEDLEKEFSKIRTKLQDIESSLAADRERLQHMIESFNQRMKRVEELQHGE